MLLVATETEPQLALSGDGGGGDAAADELDGDFARGISAAPGGLRSPMPLEATQAEALHTCRTVYSLILSCRLVALLLLAVRVMASGAEKSSQININVRIIQHYSTMGF